MRNAAEHVLEQVTALANQSAGEVDFEVIWVDNGSSDGTLQLVSESIRGDDRMRVISAPEVRVVVLRSEPRRRGRRADLALVLRRRRRRRRALGAVDGDGARRHADVVGGSLMLDANTPAVAEGPCFGFLPGSAHGEPRDPQGRVRGARWLRLASSAPARTSRSVGELNFEGSGSASRPMPSCCTGGGRPSGHG